MLKGTRAEASELRDGGRLKQKLKKLEPWRKSKQTLTAIAKLAECGDWMAAKEVIPALTRRERRVIYNLPGADKFIPEEKVRHLKPVRTAKEDRILSQISLFEDKLEILSCPIFGNCFMTTCG